MNHVEQIQTQPQLIEIGKLEKSPLNARRTVSKGGLDELKASILSHGLMQNLVVTAANDGTYRVIAGSRRLEALRELTEEGKLPAGHAVPCQVVTDERAAEMSLAENVVRLAMHPADEFEAFAQLIDAGRTPAQVAERFGVAESLVLKRLKLAGVAPELLNEYREERITLETLMAFTVTDDRDKQLKVYASLNDWQKDDPRQIRGCLTEAMAEADSKLARFVGLDAYEAAGGTSVADLFGEEIYLENADLLHRLVAEKLDGIRRDLEAKGWAWVEVNPERDWGFTGKCGRIRPFPTDVPQELIDLKEKAEDDIGDIQQALEDTESDELIDALDAAEARLAEVEERIAGYVTFDPAQKKLAGCFVSIGHDGMPDIEEGLVRPEHKKLLANTGESESLDGTPLRQKDRMPETLRRDLEAYRLQAAQAEIAGHPAIAFDLLVFHAACGIFDHVSPHDGPNVHFRRQHPKPPFEENAAADALEAIKEKLPLEWLEPDGKAARFEQFRRLAGDQKLNILACCVALTLKPKLAAEEMEPTAYDIALSLTEGDMAAYWRPARANYLSRVTRDQLLAIGRDVLGEQWAQSRHKDKKGELVDQLDRAFAEPLKHGMSPERVASLNSWLPAGMAFAIPATLSPATANQARTAA